MSSSLFILLHMSTICFDEIVNSVCHDVLSISRNSVDPKMAVKGVERRRTVREISDGLKNKYFKSLLNAL